MSAPTRQPRTAATIARQQRSVGRTLTVRAALRRAGHPTAVHTRTHPDDTTTSTVTHTGVPWPSPVAQLAALTAACRTVARIHRWISDVQAATDPSPAVLVHGGTGAGPAWAMRQALAAHDGTTPTPKES